MVCNCPKSRRRLWLLKLRFVNDGSLCLALHADEKSEWTFKPRGDLWLNGDVIMQSWTYGNADGMSGMAGWDVIILDGDGLVKELYAMIEGVHTHEFVL